MMHVLTYCGPDADLSERWVCQQCGRVILIDLARRWWDVRVAGDIRAGHTGVR